MTTELFTTPRALTIGVAQVTLALALARPSSAAAELPKMTVTRDPNCGCCGGWVAHVKAAGFPVEVIETADLAPLKARLGVPAALVACHTAEVSGYAIEGHVPAEAIKQLLAEGPQATGLAVPGMPVGSPGMEVSGMQAETYEVVLFATEGQRAFGRYRGLEAV